MTRIYKAARGRGRAAAPTRCKLLARERKPPPICLSGIARELCDSRAYYVKLCFFARWSMYGRAPRRRRPLFLPPSPTRARGRSSLPRGVSRFCHHDPPVTISRRKSRPRLKNLSSADLGARRKREEVRGGSYISRVRILPVSSGAVGGTKPSLLPSFFRVRAFRLTSTISSGDIFHGRSYNFYETGGLWRQLPTRHDARREKHSSAAAPCNVRYALQAVTARGR